MPGAFVVIRYRISDSYLTSSNSYDGCAVGDVNMADETLTE
jgi:hypothetical protein